MSFESGVKARSSPKTSQFDLFQAQLEQLLNLNHPLCILARKVDWKCFETVFADGYGPDFGAPGKATRLLVGLHYLKHAFNESEESLLNRGVENPYWQYFCWSSPTSCKEHRDTLQHDVPQHSTSLTKSGKRVAGGDDRHRREGQTGDAAGTGSGQC